MNISNEKIRILILEDDPTWAYYVESFFESTNFHSIGIANTLVKAKGMIDGLKPDLIIADINLYDGQVFDLLASEDYNSTPKIFMTSQIDEESYLETIKIPKSTYIGKPFHKFSLLSSLELLISKYPFKKMVNERFMEIRDKNQQKKKILLNEIAYITAEGNYIFIHNPNKFKFVKKKSLVKVQGELDERFLRISKTCIVNTFFIQRVDLGQQKVTVNETALTIGRGYRHELNNYLEHKI
jgi:DNA-binding LytR/AlgR family response regulator